MNHSVAKQIGLTPSCSPIKELSYSAWTRIRQCAWKGAFSRDARTRALARGSIHSAIGNARHSLEEEVSLGLSAGRPVPSSAWVEDRFMTLLQGEAAKLQTQWEPAEVPEIRTWPQINRVRKSLGRRLGDLGGAHDDSNWPEPGHVSQATGPPHLGGGTWEPPAFDIGEVRAEVWLEDSTRDMLGQLDRLSRSVRGWMVADFKSGLTASHETLKDRFRDQLTFYASLVEHCYGAVPSLEVHSLAAQPIAIECTHADVEALRRSVDGDRDIFNQQVAAATFTVTPASEESPCCWCPFQVVCPTFLEQWHAINEAILPEIRRSISFATGIVDSVSISQVGVTAAIRQQATFTSPAGEVAITRLPQTLEVAAGDHLVVSGLDASGESVLRASWNSHIRVVPGP